MARDCVKEYEKDYHKSHGTFPDCTNLEYKQLCNNWTWQKKLGGLWDNYFNVIED